MLFSGGSGSEAGAGARLGSGGVLHAGLELIGARFGNVGDKDGMGDCGSDCGNGTCVGSIGEGGGGISSGANRDCIVLLSCDVSK